METAHSGSLGLIIGPLCPHHLLQPDQPQKGPQRGMRWVADFNWRQGLLLLYFAPYQP